MAKSQWRKQYRVKRRRPIYKNRFFWLGISAVIILSSIFYLIYFFTFFQIKNIEVGREIVISEPGIGMVSEENKKKVEEMAGEASYRKVIIWEPRSIFFFNSKDVERDILKNIPQLASVQIDKKFFNQTLTISISNKNGVALWCRAEICFLIDKEGVIFEAASSTAGLIKVEDVKFIDEPVLGKTVTDKEKIFQILEITAKLKETLGITTTQAIIVSEERLDIKTSEGWEIYLNSKGDLGWQLQELVLVLEKQITPEKRSSLEYVDLRFSRVYYK